MRDSKLPGVTSIWITAANIVKRRPALFLVVSLLLAGTNMMLWQMGAYDGAAKDEVNRSALAIYLVSKLVLLLVWGLMAMRLADDPGRGIGRALKLDRRQFLWIGGMLLLLPLLLGLRKILTLVAQTALAPLGPDPRATLLIGLILYLLVSLPLMVRILPGWAGVMIGDRAVGLGWSWRASRGAVLRSLGLALFAILPIFAIHFGNNLLWISKGPALRLITLLADGAIMAFFIAISASVYVALYRRARAVSDPRGSGAPADGCESI